MNAYRGNTSPFKSLRGLSNFCFDESLAHNELWISALSVSGMPHLGGHPASLIQIPKFSERPTIVPHEVSNEPPRSCSGSSRRNEKSLYSAFRQAGSNASFFFMVAPNDSLTYSMTPQFWLCPIERGRPIKMVISMVSISAIFPLFSNHRRSFNMILNYSIGVLDCHRNRWPKNRLRAKICTRQIYGRSLLVWISRIRTVPRKQRRGPLKRMFLQEIRVIMLLLSSKFSALAFFLEVSS